MCVCVCVSVCVCVCVCPSVCVCVCSSVCIIMLFIFTWIQIFVAKKTKKRTKISGTESFWCNSSLAKFFSRKQMLYCPLRMRLIFECFFRFRLEFSGLAFCSDAKRIYKKPSKDEDTNDEFKRQKRRAFLKNKT